MRYGGTSTEVALPAASRCAAVNEVDGGHQGATGNAEEGKATAEAAAAAEELEGAAAPEHTQVSDC